MKFIGTNEEIKKQDFFKSFKNNLSNQNQNQNKKKQEEDSEEFGISNKSLEDNETNIIKNDLIKSEELIIRNKISRESIIDEVVQIQNEMIKLKGKLMVEEEINAGKIDSKIYKIIIEYSGGYFQVFLVFIFAIIWQFTMIQGNIYLTHWSNITDINDLDQNLYHFMIYTLFGIACIFSLFLKEFLISKMNYNISDNFHNEMLQNIIDAPINLYHDITPFGQIMNKFTIDLDKCVLFFRHFSSTLKCLCTLIGAIVVCVSSNRYVLFFLPIIFFFGYKVSIYYAPAGRDILRIESIDRSPLISFYSESIQGIDTIKSLSYHHVDDKFFDKFAEKLLGHLSTFLYKFGTRTFFELSLDLLSVLFVFFLFIYCIFYHQQFNAITVSLLLKYSFNISDEILTMLTHGTELENSFVRIERCESATHLPKENFDGDIIVENRNEFEGDIKLDHVCIKYRPQLDNVLEDLSVSSKKMPWKIK
jgi:ABC-type multidrug transport system fused ATPase/permease subunit